MIRRLVMSSLLLALPAVALASHTPMHHSATFTVRIENVSTPMTLKLSNGTTAPAPNSPGLWLVHTGRAPIFTTGQLDRGQGLEAQAEEGNPATLAESCKSAKGVVSSGVFDTPVGDDKPGPALPGKTYEFSFTAEHGDRLSLISMFGQSNDLFYAPDEAGIALFDAKGHALNGDITSKLLLWDAGTEVNQEPGLGADQAPRQSGPNTGASERKPVGKVKDGFRYPKTSEVLKVTITSTQAMAGR